MLNLMIHFNMNQEIGKAVIIATACIANFVDLLKINFGDILIEILNLLGGMMVHQLVLFVLVTLTQPSIRNRSPMIYILIYET